MNSLERKFKYIVYDYPNIEHHDSDDVTNKLNYNFGEKGFELISVINMGESNANKNGKSARYRYIFKKIV